MSNAKWTFTRFLHSQLFITPPIPTHSFAGKTILVTGSNTGLGLEAARHFTSLGASRVILAVRSLDKGEAAKASIESSTGKKNVVKVMHLDMSSYASVLDFSQKLAKEVGRLDIAVLNAGVSRGTWEMCELDESTITINVISTFLLAFALLPLLRRTATQHNLRPTLTFTGSETHEWADFPARSAKHGKILETLNESYGTSMHNRYQVSKLIQLLCAREMAAQITSSNVPVTVNSVNPGFCESELNREGSWILWVVWLLKMLLARTTEAGSRGLVWAGAMGEESHGAYVSDCRVEEPSKWVRSEEGGVAGKRVWEEVRGRLEGVKGGITEL